MAKVNLKALGYEQVYVSFNGASVLLKEGSEFGEGEIVSMYPQYFGGAKVEAKAPKVEAKAPKVEAKVEAKVEDKVEAKVEDKVEILTEDSSSVEVATEEVVQVKDAKK